jgi:hypothetical protein
LKKSEVAQRILDEVLRLRTLRAAHHSPV